MDSKTIWLIINTLEAIEIVATESNLSKMFAANQYLRNMAKEAEEREKGGELNA